MKWMSLTALSLALCLAALPVLFSRRETAVQPVTQMEMQQEMKPVTVQQTQQAAPMENSSDDQPEHTHPRPQHRQGTNGAGAGVCHRCALLPRCRLPFTRRHSKRRRSARIPGRCTVKSKRGRTGSRMTFLPTLPRWQGYVTEQQARERFGSYFDEYWGRVSQAAPQVDGQILVDSRGQPIVAAYHAISAGKTEPAQNVWGNELPCLTAVDSAGDRHAPGYEKTTAIPIEQLRQKLEQKLEQQDIRLSDNPAQWLAVLERSDSGYVTRMQVGGKSAERTLAAGTAGTALLRF